MHPRIEEICSLMAMITDFLPVANPFRDDESSDDWPPPRGMQRQVDRLERRQWLERDPAHPADRLYRLTAMARLQLLGGRHPEERWSRPWDGTWRMVLFDVPARENAQRERLRRYLRTQHFGLLQRSVWVTPDPLNTEREILAGGGVRVRSLILLEASPCAGESDAEIVSGAWDFDEINRRYAHLMELSSARPKGSLRSAAAMAALRRWGREESDAWMAAVSQDPLLPRSLLPAGYLGMEAWKRRYESLREAGRQFSAATLP